MDNYAQIYIDRIHMGIEKTIFKLSGVKSNLNLFFHNLDGQAKKVRRKGGKLFFFGNGASASFSNHMALDWSKNGGVLALCLSDSTMLTALANDFDFEDCFLEFLKMHSPTSNDLVITTSSSGNSKNIVKVLEYCKKNNISSFGLSGLNEGNQTDVLSEFSLFVPMKTYGMVECIHQLFHHIFLDKFMGIEDWNKTESQNMDARNFKI
ncbi:SIS domain-containing protein [Akkermansiaceae bacterium]|nr:SIS domain-containing protein [Akkermansiaceae bacterium]